MQEQRDILEILKEREAQAVTASQRGLIIQPGALGDCILTLPLAEFMKQSLRLGGIDLLSHTEYTSVFPGRTCVDGVRSIDSVRLHRLFMKSGELDLGDCDELINAFADYQWIVTFLGHDDSNFERNLIFTANCSHSAEVITLPLKPPPDYSSHICDFYIRRFVEQNILCEQFGKFNPQRTLIPASQADVSCGHKLLKEVGLDTGGKVIVIQPGSGSTCKSWHQARRRRALYIRIVPDRGIGTFKLRGLFRGQRQWYYAPCGGLRCQDIGHFRAHQSVGLQTGRPGRAGIQKPT